MPNHTNIYDLIGSTVQLLLTDGSVLNGTIISKGLTRGLAVRSHLPSASEWPFRAGEVETIHLTVKS